LGKFFSLWQKNLERIKSNGEFNIEQLVTNIMWPFGGMGSWNDTPPFYVHKLESYLFIFRDAIVINGEIN
jgi:hypothetical protein